MLHLGILQDYYLLEVYNLFGMRYRQMWSHQMYCKLLVHFELPNKCMALKQNKNKYKIIFCYQQSHFHICNATKYTPFGPLTDTFGLFRDSIPLATRTGKCFESFYDKSFFASHHHIIINLRVIHYQFVISIFQIKINRAQCYKNKCLNAFVCMFE